MITKEKLQNWGTPAPVFAGLHADYLFNIDAAADAENAKLLRYVDEERDAFKYPFVATDRVFCNPPFGLIYEFLDLGRYWAKRGSFWLFIVPANIETAWFHEVAVWGDKHVFRSRVQYVPPANYVPPIDPKTGQPKKMNSPSFASMTCMYGQEIRASGTAFSRVRCGKTGRLL